MESISLGNILINMQTTKEDSVATQSTQKVDDKNDFKAHLNKLQNSTDKRNSKNDVKEISKKTSSQLNNKENVLKSKGLDEEMVEQDEVEVDQTVESAILSLLSQSLGIPKEELAGILEDLSYSVVELLEPEKFNAFINEVYPELTAMDLLTDENLAKRLSELFTKIEETIQIIPEEQKAIIVEKVIVDDQVVQKQVHTVESNVDEVVDEIIPEQNLLHDKASRAELTETVQRQVLTNQDKSKDIETTNMKVTTLSVASEVVGLGITMPVETFNKSVEVTSWTTQKFVGNSQVEVKDTVVARQVIDQLELIRSAHQDEIRMQLYPKELGQLSIKIVQTSGVLTADIGVENEKTKAFLLEEINTLKEALQIQGIDIGEVKVDIRHNDTQSQMQQQKQKSSRRIQEIIAGQMNELDETEDLKEKISQSEINYVV